MISVIKRNGDIVEYDFKKIENAIEKAIKATNVYISEYQLSLIYMGIMCDIRSKCNIYGENDIGGSLSVEEIQDIVEKHLVDKASYKLSKAYIVYRANRELSRKMLYDTVSISESVDEYLSQSDWRVHENANSGFSVGGLQHSISSKVVANFWLNNIYTKDISEAHRKGFIHIHDLGFLGPYCQGHSLRQLIAEGFGGVNGESSSGPAKHMYTIVNQIINFVYTLQNEAAGAQAFSSVDTLLAPFVEEDNLTYKQTKQCIQSLIYGMNVPSRSCHQKPFVNFTFDLVCPDDLKDQVAIVGGKPQKDGYVYGQYQRAMDYINKAFIEIMIEGDINGRGFSFPIPTYNITKDFNWDSEVSNLLFDMAGRYGTPTFQNFINSDLDVSQVRAMCCRLSLDKSVLLKRGGGLFGSNEFTGSLGVCTINLPRIAYLSDKNDGKKSFFKMLEKYLDICKNSLEIKRKTVQKLTDNGLYPYTKRYLQHWNNHFSTIGIIGAHEACLMQLNKGIGTDEGKAFAGEILDFCNVKLLEYQNETGNLYNLEASPAEGATYRLAKLDQKEFISCKHSGDELTPYYTNSTALPVNYTDDIFEALDHQESLQVKYTGGTINHVFLGQNISSETCKELVRTISNRYKIPFFSITPTYSICEDHGYISGNVSNCEKCGKLTKVYSRVVGYYQPVINWNIGKKNEFRDRKVYRL